MIFLKKVFRYLYIRLWCFESTYVFCHSKAKSDVNQPNNQVDNLLITQATKDNLQDILNFQNNEYVEVFKQFLASGDKGYLGYYHNECVHRSWLKLGPQAINFYWSYAYRLTPQQGYIHYCETATKVRGLGIYAAVLRQIVADYPHKEMLICTQATNIASRKGIEKAGFRLMMVIKTRAILGIKRVTTQLF